MKKIFLLSLIALLGILQTGAQQPARVPAYPGVIERVQPNKDTIHIFLRGDEHQHFMMTTDGWQVQERNNGKICYCKQKKDGTVKVTNRQAHDANKRKKCEKKWLEKHGVKKI